MPVETIKLKTGEERDYFRLPHPKTGSQLAALPYRPADAIVPGLLFRQHVTLLSGQPKAGKSTFVRDVLRRSLAAVGSSLGLGKSYLSDRLTQAARILILSEENVTTWVSYAHDLRDRLGPGPLDEIEILCRDDGGIIPADAGEVVLWAEAVADHALVRKFDIVVIDPVSRFGGIQDENSSTDVRMAMFAFQKIATAGQCAVLGIHHTAKSGTTPRGSGAWQAEADVLASFEVPDKPEKVACPDCHDDSRLRVLHCKGRVQSIEPVTYLWLDQDGDYRATTPSAIEGLRDRVERDGDTLIRALRDVPVARISRLAEDLDMAERHAMRAAMRLAELNAVLLGEDDGHDTIRLAYGGEA